MTGVCRVFLMVASAIVGYMSPSSSFASTKIDLYSFFGYQDGSEPRGRLLRGPNGGLYGTTSAGGTTGKGTVFKLTPPAAGGTEWTKTVLWNFAAGAPAAGLVRGPNGGLYGTTSQGGAFGRGTVFKLTPPATGGTEWTKTVLWSFGAPGDGATPLAGLVRGPNGGLYGTTSGGGKGYGTVFKLTPPAAGGTQWTETLLYSFKGAQDGIGPVSGLILGPNGGVYGTTQFGGTSNRGIVYKLTPPTWTKTTLYSFKGGTGDGSKPIADLVRGPNGGLYGTTSAGGLFGGGTVFKLTPPAPGGTVWTETVLWSFGNSGDGATPNAGLVRNANGVLYGQTAYGGANGNASVGGTVFKLTPPAPGGTEWTETVLYSFSATEFPHGGLIMGPNGGLYGITVFGGSMGFGSVFKVIP